MHIYAFGSVCRGDVVAGSDVDLLAIVERHDSRFDPSVYSIYSYNRIKDLWCEGNPFAWHLSLESRLIYASDDKDYLGSLGVPNAYLQCRKDCRKFFSLFKDARGSLKKFSGSRVFDLSTIFLSIRNIATCYSLGMTETPNFSRNSAIQLGQHNLPITRESYDVLVRSRILCTRGYGSNITNQHYLMATSELDQIEYWMQSLLDRVESGE